MKSSIKIRKNPDPTTPGDPEGIFPPTLLQSIVFLYYNDMVRYVKGKKKKRTKRNQQECFIVSEHEVSTDDDAKLFFDTVVKLLMVL